MALRSSPLRILVIEDDRETSDYIAKSLRDEGHTVDCVLNGSEGLKVAATKELDVLVVDRMLPGLDGLSIVKALRGAGMKAPVLFVTSLGGIDDRVEGLERPARQVQDVRVGTASGVLGRHRQEPSSLEIGRAHV